MAVTVTCPQCLEYGRGRVVMTHLKELPTGNNFECHVCGTLRFVTKDRTGGTVGSGARDDGRVANKGSVGVGFGPGTATFRGKQ